MPIYPASKISSLKLAARSIRSGGLVAFPTETVYGLGADAMNPTAVAKIFAAKKRPFFDPLIVHIADINAVRDLWTDMPLLAQRLAEAFWPGPLTLVYRKRSNVPDIVTAGLDTVAVRMPDHPTALELIRLSGTPIAAPSANLFGRTSPTTAQAVRDDLGSRVRVILDAGACRVGVESTVLKIETRGVTLLRPGGVPLEALRKICPVRFSSQPKTKSSKMRSPGLLESHYAPVSPMVLIPGLTQAVLKRFAARYPKLRLACLLWTPMTHLPRNCHAGYLSRRRNLTEAAAKLFETIRKLDKMKPDLILAQALPKRALGLAIMDRLMKASSGRVGFNQAEQLLRKGDWK